MPPRRDTPARATPARATRSSSRAPGPLPVIETKPSHAYGSRGKATLTSQVTASHAAIDDAFDQSRDEMPPPPKPLSSHAKQPSPSQQQDQPNGTASNAVVAANETEMRPGTSLDRTGYNAAAAAAAAAATPRSARRSTPARPARPERPEPSAILVFMATASRFISTWQFWAWLCASWLTFVAYLALFANVAAFTKLPTREMEVSRDRFFYHMTRSIGRNTTLVPPDYMEGQRTFNLGVWEKVQVLDTLQPAHNALSNQVGLLSETVQEIQQVLPSMVVVVDKDGETVIPPAFWEALVERMGSEEASPLWNQFLASNEEKMQDYMNHIVDTQLEGVAVKHKLITSTQFETLLADNNQIMEQKFNSTLRMFQALVLQEAKAAAREAAEDIFESTHLAKGQISALAYSNLVVNIDNRMRDTNYFSRGLGAVVQPTYTFPTWREPSFAQMLGRWAWKGVGTLTSVVKPQLSVNPNTAALTEWSENGDCWCTGSPDDADVKLQIAVRVPFNVYPRWFIIEHIPASGTRDIASAPKNFEVWIKMGSKEDVDKLTQTLRDRRDVFSPKFCGDPPRSSSSINTVDNGTWFCAMHARYDIHGTNYIQQFMFPANPWDIGLETWTVVLKVVDNWGADHTCLYRIRLNADEVENHINHRLD